MTDRTLYATGWVGDGPNGTEAPYLMLHAADDLRELADAMGLRPGRMTPRPAGMTAILTGHHVTVARHGTLLVERPVDADWSAVARSYGRVVLVVSLDPLPTVAGLDHLDRHLDTADTALALLPIR